jgi:hypothetical protein
MTSSKRSTLPFCCTSGCGTKSPRRQRTNQAKETNACQPRPIGRGMPSRARLGSRKAVTVPR